MRRGESRSLYYVIFTILQSGDETRLFPFVYNDKASSDRSFEKLTSGNVISASSFGLDFDDAEIINIEPFLYLEKTIITTDEIVSEETILGTSEGSIESAFIPMDFVSNVYFKQKIHGNKSSVFIDRLIEEASVVL